MGLVTAACYADLGHEVILCDIEAMRIADLEAGRVPIHEPGLGELLDRNRDRLRFTTRAADVFHEGSACVRLRRDSSHVLRGRGSECRLAGGRRAAGYHKANSCSS